ncbi:transcription initiation factor TFIID subunit 7 [Cocos nucifera]|uniref:Transcription initiation factor TFIID subunit 7 n=1 Tax=Cocos nucifera TaxID=13894 RepID=A0A8K0IBH8_COCNU|nr:transcription initiation factor TFIID subunit 7 [Cocos nucifera]
MSLKAAVAVVSLEGAEEDGRTGTFMIGNERFPASLLDLPCMVESYKTYDDTVLIKTADIGQIIMVREEGDPAPEGIEYKHGLTPPMRDARRRRFRREPDLNCISFQFDSSSLSGDLYVFKLYVGVEISMQFLLCGQHKKPAETPEAKPEDVPLEAATNGGGEREKSDSDDSLEPES